jgi:hypothetical protein
MTDKVLNVEAYMPARAAVLLTRAQTSELIEASIDDAENWIVSKLKRKGAEDRMGLLAQLDAIIIIRERINARLSYSDPINRK